MYLFIGLGNTGDKFEGTRHNIGRETLLAAQKKFGLPAFALDTKLSALVAEGKTGPRRVLGAGPPTAKGGLGGKERTAFILPETFVNKSGTVARPALRRFQARPKNIVLVHDDVDMLLGKTKLSFGRNSAGHKGVESVMRALETKDFWRMRIGVQKKRRVPGEDLVLQKFRGEEEALAKKIIKKNLEAIGEILTHDPEYAMNAYNR